MTHDDIAKSLVAARKSARALSAYPGAIPAQLADSYSIQERAIQLWDKPIIGWKIGRLHPDKQAEHGTERLAGPIFAPTLKAYAGETITLPVFKGGFAAVEAEYVFRTKHDTDPAKTSYTEDEAALLIDAIFAGIEMAGSPLATINALGPTVVASDFGNNFGLVLGDTLISFGADASTAELSPDSVKIYKAKTEIDGKTVGDGGLFAIPGGPLKAIAWLAGHLAERGRPLTKGQYISSGATTGIHNIGPDQNATVTFSGPSGTQTLQLKTIALTGKHSEIA